MLMMFYMNIMTGDSETDISVMLYSSNVMTGDNLTNILVIFYNNIMTDYNVN